MPIVKITGQGLAAIALSVALLWACFVAERVVARHSLARQAQVIRELRELQLQHRTQPVSTPMPRLERRPRTTVG